MVEFKTLNKIFNLSNYIRLSLLTNERQTLTTLNRAFAKETGSHPSGAQPQNPVPGATASQFRWLSGEIEKINKQIQSIHQKLGGKEGHTITSLSLQNYYDIREIARLNDAILI